MKILAPKAEYVLRSLHRAGLTPKQANKLLNRTMLCLHYIGKKKRVSVEVFACFKGEVRANGHRLRFNQLLLDAKLIKKTCPHIQSLYSTEYQCKGKAVEQEIKLSKAEAQIMRKVAATHRKTAKADETLQWLNNSSQHVIEDGLYFTMTQRLGWECKPFSRLLAGLVAESLRRKVHERYLVKCKDSGLLVSGLSLDFDHVVEVQRFADRLAGEPCTIEDLSELDHGRIERMVKTEGWGWLRKRFLKDIVDSVTRRLRAKEVHLACDTEGLYSPNSDALEMALVQETQRQLNVDITRRDQPILTPIYIYNLRKLYAAKHEIPFKEAPKARSLHWQDSTPFADPKPRQFKEGEQILETVEDAKAFYGVDLEGEEIITLERARVDEANNELALYIGRKQINRWGSIRSSNALGVYAQLYELGHALPTEPTRQNWELTKRGEEELRGRAKSPSKPLPEPNRAESYATYTNLTLLA